MWSSYVLLYAVLTVLINVDGSKDTRLNDAAFNLETTTRDIQKYIRPLQTSSILLETTLETYTTEARHGPRTGKKLTSSEDENGPRENTNTPKYNINISNKNATDTTLLHRENSIEHHGSGERAIHQETVQRKSTPVFSKRTRNGIKKVVSRNEFGPVDISNINRQSSYETRFNQRKRSRPDEEDNILIKNTKKTDIQKIKARKYKRETHIDDRKPYQNNVNGQTQSATPYPQNRNIKEENNFEHINQSDYTQDDNLNNTELSNETYISQQNNSLSSLESMINNRERNYQVILKVLVYLDTEFNGSIAIVWNYTGRFPNFKHLKMDDDMINSTEHYTERRRDGLLHLNDSIGLKLLSSSKAFSGLPLGDDSLFERRLTEFGEMQLILTILGNIPKIKLNETNGLNCFNISKPNNLTDGEILNEENVKYTNRMELALNHLKEVLNKSKLAGNIVFRWDITNMTTEGEVCLESIDGELRNQTTQEGYKGKLKLSKLGEILRDFVYPIVYIVFLILGVIGNGTLLIMFARHKELRTSSNIMIFNLVIVDILNLFVNVPVYYVSKYYSELIYFDGYGCRAYSSFRYLIHTVIMLSIVALSAQRYCASVPVLNGKRSHCRLSARCTNVFYVSSVWIISFIRAVPPLFVFEFRKGTCFPFSNSKLVQILNILYFIIFCFLLPVAMGILSLKTAKSLKMSVRNIPGIVANKNREVSRYRSAKVVTGLAIVYSICFSPRFVWVFLMSYFRLDRRLPQYVLIDELTNYLMIPNSCLNPLALYIASGTYRKLFNRYLFAWRESEISKNPPLERKTTASSNTRVDYVSESVSGEMYGSKSSVISRHISRKYSRE